MRRVLLWLIRFYRAAVSPLLPSSCRYVPSCSEYALIAVRRFGAARGGWMAVRRVFRCHPFGGRGYDPVPAGPEEPTPGGAPTDAAGDGTVAAGTDEGGREAEAGRPAEDR